MRVNKNKHNSSNNDITKNYPRKSFKRKDSKQTKVVLLIKEYFTTNNEITRNKFDDFLKFIELKSIWCTEEEQDVLWNSIIAKKNKTSIDYETALKGIMELFTDDDDTKHNNSNDNYSLEDNNETIDKYLKSFNNNQEYLYDIEFINFIYLDKDKDIINLSNNDIDNIVNDIKSKYKFITLSDKEIKNYFNCFNFSFNKDLINHANTSIENLLDQNKVNSNSNNNSRSISFSTSANDTNSYKNTSSFNLNHTELFDKLLSLDKIIFDCMDSLILFYKNKHLINLTQKFIQNYLLYTKNNIYNTLKLMFENDNRRKISEISCLNEDNNITNNNIVKNNENILNTEKPKSKYLSKRELIYIKKEMKPQKSNSNLLNNNNRRAKRNLLSNNIEFNNTDNNDNNDINNDNIFENNDNDNDNDNNYNVEPKLRKSISHQKDKHNRVKSDVHNKLTTLDFKKLKKNISYCNFNKMTQIKETDIFNLNNKKKIVSRNNCFTDIKGSKTQRDDERNNVFVEESIEDLNLFSFSNNIADQFLCKTENIENLDEDNENDNEIDDIINKGTPTLNPLDGIDNDDYDDDYDDLYVKNENININKEKENLSKCQNPNNFTFGKDDNNNNTIKIKLSGDIDSSIPNYMSNNKLYTLSSNNKKFVKIGYYDFKYLYKNNNIKKIFNHNYEKINPMKFLSDDVYIIPNNALKKTKVILVITESFFYLFKSTIQMNCISKYSNKVLKSISISSRNCNLILFTFDKTPDLIIETYRRYEILKFIKEYVNKKLKINISHNFSSKKKHGETESINSKKIKLFTYTPNFENAIKLGILSKYQENFFSSRFHERLVVLCCLGLMYFEENEKSPKAIIPIIGATIKFIVLQGNDKLYCFQIKTINEENYIFGSKIKKEILDWIHEFSLVKKNYFLKLKEIEPNLVLHEKNKSHKQKTSA